MGSGISKTALMRHSDSRVEEIRAQIAAAGDRHRVTSVSTGGSGDDHNSTFSLRLTSSLEGSPQPPLRPADTGSPGGKRSRARSYPDLDQLQLWQPVHTLAALHEGSDTGSEAGAASRSSSSCSSPHGASAHEKTPRADAASVESNAGASAEVQAEEGDHYDSDEFEDEITDWRKGETIGSGSYGTASRGRSQSSSWVELADVCGS